MATITRRWLALIMKSSSFALLVNVRIGFKRQGRTCDVSGFILWGHEHKRDTFK